MRKSLETWEFFTLCRIFWSLSARQNDMWNYIAPQSIHQLSMSLCIDHCSILAWLSVSLMLRTKHLVQECHLELGIEHHVFASLKIDEIIIPSSLDSKFEFSNISLMRDNLINYFSMKVPRLMCKKKKIWEDWGWI